MIIGFDASRAFVSGRTGTENYSYQLLKNLAGIDTKNQYIVYVRPGSVDQYIGVSVDQKKLDWPENFEFKVINWPRLWTQAGLASQTFKDKLDVLFVPAHTIPIIKRPGLKTVVTVHDLGSEYLPGMHQLKQRLYLGYMQRRQLKSATKIIAVSKATKDDLVKRIGLPSEKIEVVYEGYDKELFKPVKNDLLVNSLKSLDLVSGEYFLFVGTIQPRKNIYRLITAYDSYYGPFKKAPKLVLVGSKGWLSDDIYKLVKTLGLEDRVKFLGRVDDEKLPALYSGAIALTFPSLFEGFGLPILEAQACGCPVITSNLSSMPEVAGKGAILVDPYSVNEIAAALRMVTSDKVKVTSLVRDGYENIKRFSWEKCAGETLDVLEGLQRS